MLESVFLSQTLTDAPPMNSLVIIYINIKLIELIQFGEIWKSQVEFNHIIWNRKWLYTPSNYINFGHIISWGYRKKLTCVGLMHEPFTGNGTRHSALNWSHYTIHRKGPPMNHSAIEAGSISPLIARTEQIHSVDGQLTSLGYAPVRMNRTDRCGWPAPHRPNTVTQHSSGCHGAYATAPWPASIPCSGINITVWLFSIKTPLGWLSVPHMIGVFFRLQPWRMRITTRTS